MTTGAASPWATSAWLAERWFALDTRSLALFRVGLGLLVVCDAALRLPDLAAHYSDAGVVPRALIFERLGGDLPLSLHVAHGSAAFAAALFALQMLAGACLAAGWHTRVATALAWGLVLSLTHRNPFVMNWGDVILRLLLFWSLFLPLAERASLDRRRAAPGPPARAFLGLGSAGFVVQIACIYVFAALLKTGSDWQDGSAVAAALSHEMIARQPQAALALGHPELLAALTHVVRWFEALGPLLLFVPVAHGAVRTAAVLAFWSFHLGLLLFIDLGLFAWICGVAWSALLPGAFWDRIGVTAGDGPALARRRQWPALAALALVLVSNVATLGPPGSVPGPLRAPLRWTGLYQHWGMFAPNPQRYARWLVVAGRRDDGRDVDLLWGGPPSFAKPPGPAPGHGVGWTTYMRKLGRERPPLRRAYAQWLCREHAARGDALESVTLHSVSAADGPVRFWHEECTPREPPR